MVILNNSAVNDSTGDIGNGFDAHVKFEAGDWMFCDGNKAHGDEGIDHNRNTMMTTI